MENIDFEVSDKRRAVWNEELKMLEIFKRICEENNLTYYAIGGTLLGAIRHEGYIPWDDDMDIAMFREDYDKFIKAAKKSMPKGYFLQIPETEKDYFFGHAKIRKNGTSAIRYIQYPERYSHHQGIFIDIFPLDNIPDNKRLYKLHKFVSLKLMQMVYFAKYYYRLNHHKTITKIKHAFCTLLMPTNSIVRLYFNLYLWVVKLPNRKKTKMAGMTSMFYHMDDNFSWQRKWFDKSVAKRFENTEINVPAGYDKILTKNYGDYMVPVKGGSQHGEIFFDLEHDYRDYYNGKRKFSKKDLIL